MHQEKCSLTWHTYSDHLRSMMKDLMTTDDFADVTLVTDDKQHIKVHKNILSSCSPVFKEILQKDKNSNPIIFLRGINFSEIESIMQYIYLGEATFYVERINEFLAVAKSLEIKELCNAVEPSTEQDDKPSPSVPEISAVKLEDTNLTSNKIETKPEVKELCHAGEQDEGSRPPLTSVEKLEEKNVTSNNIELQQDELRDVVGVNWCKICDKAYSSTWALKEHNQAAHQGLKYACNQCKYKSTLRGNLKKHILSKHKGTKYPCNLCDYVAPWVQTLSSHKRKIHRFE